MHPENGMDLHSALLKIIAGQADKPDQLMCPAARAAGVYSPV